MKSEAELLDWFAGLAMQALIVASASTSRGEDGKPLENHDTHFWAMRELGPGGMTSEDASFVEIAAWEAYVYAKAMLKERKNLQAVEQQETGNGQ